MECVGNARLLAGFGHTHAARTKSVIHRNLSQNGSSLNSILPSVFIHIPCFVMQE